MERRRALHMVEIDCLCTAHVHFPIRRCSTTTRIPNVERTVMRSEESRLSKFPGNVSILTTIIVGFGTGGLGGSGPSLRSGVHAVGDSWR